MLNARNVTMCPRGAIDSERRKNAFSGFKFRSCKLRLDKVTLMHRYWGLRRAVVRLTFRS